MSGGFLVVLCIFVWFCFVFVFFLKNVFTDAVSLADLCIKFFHLLLFQPTKV